jgi:Domain of unknown function (DUF4386)
MIATSLLLILLPVAFNVVFALLGVLFEYPAILRKPTSEILAKFRAGGSRLILVWWAFAMTTVLFIPVAILLPGCLDGANPTVLIASVVVGVLAALVQILGLIRWTFLVPFLAREDADASPARRDAIDLIFQAFHRYLGVAVGEHFGYLFTGAWSILVGVSVLQAGLPAWLGIAGIVVGATIALCSLEFVGPFEREGWKLAGAVIPIAYIAWSIWLAALGVVLLLI